MQKRVCTPSAVTSDVKQCLTDTWANVSQNVIDEAVGQWRKWLVVTYKHEAKGHHFEHLLN